AYTRIFRSDRPRRRRFPRTRPDRADGSEPARGRPAARRHPAHAPRHARPGGRGAAGEAGVAMKCPTCGYIGFEASDRCRNCGYDFTMAAQTRTAPDLPLRTEDSEGVLRDLDLAMPPANRGGSEPQPDLDRVMSSLDRVLGGPEASDLPLFESEDRPPLIAADAPPRRPLAVRRTTPDPARLRPKPVRHTPRALQEPELPLRPPAPEPEPEGAPAVQVASDAPLPGAPPAARALAAIVDVGL